MRMQKLSVGLIGGGAMALALSVVTGWLGFPHVLRTVIKKSARLERGTETWKTWVSPGEVFQVYLSVYFFNVTNGLDVAEGGKPSVKEIGPYVYQEKRAKVDVEEAAGGDRVTYRQKSFLHFRPDMSNGGQDDLVTFINIPFVAVAKMGATLSGNSAFVLGDLDEDLVEKGERLFRTESVRKLLLEGFSVQNYIELLEDPLVATVVGEVAIPKSFQGGTFAIYKGKNGSDDGLWEVKTGFSSFRDVGQVVKWNNGSELKWWTDRCNALEGTDGTLFAPFLQRHHTLKSYSPELCRSISMAYVKDISYKGIPGYRFSPVRETSLGVEKYPPNWCFCAEADKAMCNRNGLMMLSSCKEGAPVSLSNPHFYDADADIVGAVSGLGPDVDLHKTFIDLEPSTGVMMRARKRLQFNVDVRSYGSSMSTFAKVRPLAFPVMWAEERAELPEEVLKLLKQVRHAQDKMETARWSMVGVSLACFCLGVLWTLCHNENKAPTQLGGGY